MNQKKNLLNKTMNMMLVNKIEKNEWVNINTEFSMKKQNC